MFNFRNHRNNKLMKTWLTMISLFLTACLAESLKRLDYFISGRRKFRGLAVFGKHQRFAKFTKIHEPRNSTKISDNKEGKLLYAWKLCCMALSAEITKKSICTIWNVNPYLSDKNFPKMSIVSTFGLSSKSVGSEYINNTES